MVALTVAPELVGYRDLSPLGRGGYSEVYRAYQEMFDRWVAVKLLTFPLGEERARRRFLRECQVAGRVSAHPHIVTVFDAGLGPDGRPYLALELYDGGSLAERLAAGGALDVGTALRTAVALAGALESAHRAGVVHRDVKPGNVFLTGYGHAALGDFGLSVVAEHHEVTAGIDALSPYHAPPEVLEGVSPTPVSDVYSLASTTYTTLAGHPPHALAPGEALASLLARIVGADVPPVGRPDVPRSLDAALHAALARDPAARTPSALAFAEALQRVQDELGLEPTEPVLLDTPRSRPPDDDRSHPHSGGGHANLGGRLAEAEPAEGETVHRSRVPGPWPPAPSGGGTGGRSRRRMALVAAGLLGIAAVGGAAFAVTAGGGDAERATDRTATTSTSTSTSETTVPASTTTAPPPETTAPAPEPTDLAVADVSASVTAPDSADGCGARTTYGAANAVDGANNTGWSVVGDATGETLTLDLGGERRVTSVGLLPGYAKVDACTGVDRFPENRRPTTVTWRFDDGTEAAQPLDDAPELQAVAVDATTTTIELTIGGVTSNPRRDYTVISEVAVRGT